MPYRTCDHRKADGILCGSPALRGKRICYYHQREQQREVNLARVLRRADPLNPHAAVPKTRPDVLAALQQVLTALADQRIHPKRAGILLFGLQQAAVALRKPRAAAE